MKKEISLKVNNQTIGMNPFVKKALVNTIEGFVLALDRIPVPIEQIEIRITANAGQKSQKRKT